MSKAAELLRLSGMSADCTLWQEVAARLESLELYAKAAEACALGLGVEREPELLAMLVRNLERVGLKHEALRHLYDLYTLQPDRPGIREHVVTLSLQAGRPDVTVQFVRDLPTTLRWLQAEITVSDDKALRFGRAFLLYHEGKYGDAVAAFQPLQKHADWSIWAHSMSGLCFYKMGELYPSLDHFHVALSQVDPEQAFEYRELYFNRACVLYVHGKLRETLASLQQLWQMDPQYPELEEWIVEVRELLSQGDEGGAGRAALVPPGKPVPTLRSARKLRDRW